MVPASLKKLGTANDHEKLLPEGGQTPEVTLEERNP